jgi:NAD-dependent dihydropyrimidine dehydrogenase PreA subunit
MLTLYFSGTGNTEYLAREFSARMDGECLSVEEGADFDGLIKGHDTVCFCYPIYGSRPPFIMREFVLRHLEALEGKKLIILVTQMMFSGDGARAFADLLPDGHAEIIYAEHFNMPNNVCNFIVCGLTVFREPSEKKLRKIFSRVETKVEKACRDIKAGIVIKRGFNGFSRALGKVQGIPWIGSMEPKARRSVKIDDKLCTKCGLCTKICPMKNQNNCTVCYRCVNRCPQRAITVFIHKKPRWQYKKIP